MIDPIILFKKTVLFGVTGLGLIALAGCTQTANLGPTPQSQASANKPVPASFPDLPIPAGAKMIVDKTLVVGAENWFGQLALNAAQPAAEAFDFYRARLPEYGWQEITSVRAPVSVLTFEREARILQMQIAGGTLTGSEITITVSPRGTPSNLQPR